MIQNQPTEFPGKDYQITNYRFTDYPATRSSSAAALDDPYPALSEDYPSTDSHHTRPETDLFRYHIVKRFIDILLVLISLPVLLPVIGIIALLVKATSPGPVFFSHRRIRRNAGSFAMWKFRTMCVDSAAVLDKYLAQHPGARAEWHHTHKLRNDPRITRVGSFLRRYSLDELPQVWNVLTGKMSLVGPRPIVTAEVEKYGDCFLCYCHVKPGLTGLWQVSGRNELSYEERVRLDCNYVQNWSLFLDFKILLRTFSSVVSRDGAF